MSSVIDILCDNLDLLPNKGSLVFFNLKTMQEQLFKKCIHYKGWKSKHFVQKHKKEEEIPKKNIGVSPVAWFWAVGLFCVTDFASYSRNSSYKIPGGV